MRIKTWLIEKLGGFPNSSSAIDALCLVGGSEEESELARTNLIRRLGGFATIDDAIEEIRTKGLKERHEILTLAVKKLFNTIGSEDILRPADGNQWMLEGKPLSKGQVDLLIAEAAQFEKSYLFKVLKKDILYQANKKMYLLAENVEHIVTAKFWLYTFDVFQTRIKSMAAGSALFNHKGKQP